jgi:hypothetical protein
MYTSGTYALGKQAAQPKCSILGETLCNPLCSGIRNRDEYHLDSAWMLVLVEWLREGSHHSLGYQGTVSFRV